MATAEIIAIGTELLLGEIQDTNTCTLARYLRSLGIDLYRTTTVGDNVKRIAAVVREAHARSDIVITTGGLGPTVDDPTREAIALAVNTDLVFDDTLWQIILKRFERYGRVATDNNRRQAYLPRTAQPVLNNVGTAPAFLIDNDGAVIISLPGVPKELEYIFETEITPYLKNKFQLSHSLYIHVIHLSGAGESQIDELIGDLERYENPTIGLVANAGQIDIRVTTKAASQVEAEALYATVYQTIKERLGDAIIGVDSNTLISTTLDAMSQLSGSITITCAGFSENIAKLLQQAPLNAEIAYTDAGTILIRANCPYQENSKTESALTLATNLVRSSENARLETRLITPISSFQTTRYYGGPPAMADDWAINSLLDQIRRIIKN